MLEKIFILNKKIQPKIFFSNIDFYPKCAEKNFNINVGVPEILCIYFVFVFVHN
jgi:hypothetical protein